MYEQYWRFDRNPFAHNDSDFFFGSQTHQAALLKLRYLVENNKGAGLLIGDPGYGKTYLLEQLSRQLDERFSPFIHMVFPQLNAAEFMSYLASKLGAEDSQIGDGESGLNRTIQAIEQRLLFLGEQGQHPVIVIDEAHVIEDVKVFQAIQLLLNYQRQPGINFSVILAGQRILLSRTSRIPQLDERLSVKSLLQPMSREDTVAYINGRMESVGSTEPIFDAAAMDELFELSGGVPRKINQICDLALLVGYADGLAGLSGNHVAMASEELTSVMPD
ncbi:MAG: hypothetical protein CMJ78_14130 [Planctomycetaceae bacterium]|nr:hypothetical protein [Planctomycetaceae bacterium]